MKKYLLFTTFLLLFSILSFGQSGKEVSLFYGKSLGVATFSVLRSGFLMGAGSGALRENNSFGIKYLTRIKGKKRSIETGIYYLRGKLEIHPAPTGDPIHDAYRKEDFNLISVPAYMHYDLGKYFYLNTGISVDYQKATTDTYTGFGMGIGLGVGFKYKYNNLVFYLNPKYEKHLFFSIKHGLMELGMVFGVGYVL